MTHNITIVLDLHFSSVCDNIVIVSVNIIVKFGSRRRPRGRAARPPSSFFI